MKLTHTEVLAQAVQGMRGYTGYTVLCEQHACEPVSLDEWTAACVAFDGKQAEAAKPASKGNLTPFIECIISVAGSSAKPVMQFEMQDYQKQLLDEMTRAYKKNYALATEQRIQQEVMQATMPVPRVLDK